MVEDDTHLSKWVEQFGELKVVGPILNSVIRHHVKPGMTVCDVGACIGDHAELYRELVGQTGTVHCFEPNPESFECLEYNMRKHENVILHNTALGSQDSTCSIIKSHNLGACRVSEGGSINVTTLDKAVDWERLDFLKIDAEGCEPLILQGAISTIRKFKPVMLIEVNKWVLEPRFSKDGLLKQITNFGYYFHVCDPRYSIKDPEFDVVCIPE